MIIFKKALTFQSLQGVVLRKRRALYEYQTGIGSFRRIQPEYPLL